MKRIGIGISLILLLFSFTSCVILAAVGLIHQGISGAELNSRRGNPYNPVHILKFGTSRPELAQKTGYVVIKRRPGSTHFCTLGEVLRAAADYCDSRGGNFFFITELLAPDDESNCYRLKGEALKVNPSDSAWLTTYAYPDSILFSR